MNKKGNRMATLAVNVDHVATLRQARQGNEPDPVAAALLAELGGCHGIIVHLREDRRHIQDRDVEVLRKTVRTRLNLEMAATEEMIGIAALLVPDRCTLVPEKRQELTTEGGLNVAGNVETITRAVSRLRNCGIAVSLFVDPDPRQIRAAKRSGAGYIEIHTGLYANARTDAAREGELNEIARSAELASGLGMRVFAGHGLDYQNVEHLNAVAEIEEFSIGHSIVARAVLVGMERAVKEMVQLVR
jgi:pyridoxine 5-phosphate synthase